MAEMPATRVSLLVRLRDPHDDSAWRQFVGIYGPVINHYARKQGLQDAWLEMLINRLMAKDPAQRFASAAQVAELPEGYLAHLRQPTIVPAPESAQPDDDRLEALAPQPIKRFPRRLWVVAVLVLVALCLGAWFSGWGDATRARVVEAPPTKPNDVWSVAISRDGSYVAAAAGWWDQPGQVGLWDLRTRQLKRLFSDGLGVASIAFSPDGKLLAWSGWSGHVRLVNPASGEDVADLEVPGVARIAFSPDGTLLAAATEAKTVRLFQVPSGEIVAELQGDLFRFHCVAFTPDGRRVLAGGGEWKPGGICQVNVWDLETRQQVLTLKSNDQAILALAVSPDSKLMASGGVGGVIHLWNADTGKEETTLRANRQWIHALTFASDGKTLVSAGQDLAIHFHDLVQGKETKIVGGAWQVAPVRPDNAGAPEPAPVAMDTPWTCIRALALTPDGGTLVAGGGPRLVRVYELASNKATTLPWEAPGVIPDGEVPPAGRPWLAIVLIIAAVGLTGWFLAYRFRKGEAKRSRTQQAPAKTAAEPTSAPPAPFEILACSGCGKRLKVPSALAGKNIKCPKCGTKVP
jgi:WD40 repeat protein